MADTNSILWQAADQIRARLGNADLYCTKVSLSTITASLGNRIDSVSVFADTKASKVSLGSVKSALEALVDLRATQVSLASTETALEGLIDLRATQVSLGAAQVSIGSLDTRVISLEAGGGGGGGGGLTNWTETNGHILPDTTEAYDLGSADYKVRHLFLSDNSLKFVDANDVVTSISKSTFDNIEGRLAVLEGGGGTPSGFTSQDVTWTNLTEIAVSGEKLVNEEFTNTTSSGGGNTLELTLSFQPTDVGGSGVSYSAETDLAFTHDSNAYGSDFTHTYSANGVANSGKKFVVAWFNDFSDMNSNWLSGWALYEENGGSLNLLEYSGSGCYGVATLDINNVLYGTAWDSANYTPFDLDSTALPDGSWYVDYDGMGGSGSGSQYEATYDAGYAFQSDPTDNYGPDQSAFEADRSGAASGGSSTLTLDNWTVITGTLDQTQLAAGIVQGDGGTVAIQQELATPIPTGTKLVAKVTRVDTATTIMRIRAIWSTGETNHDIDPTIGYVEIEVPAGKTLNKVRIVTQNATRSVTDVSLYQGEVAGGSVQASGGGLEKISGADGYNAGASSTASIGGNSDGYVQFQYAVASKALKVGLVTSDVDFADADPYELTINADGSVDTESTSQSAAFASQGDWFRIRHYASSNEIQYQRKQEIFENGVSMGFDYVTFHTHSTLTTGANLFVDTSFYHNTGRINDVTIAS